MKIEKNKAEEPREKPFFQKLLDYYTTLLVKRIFSRFDFKFFNNFRKTSIKINKLKVYPRFNLGESIAIKNPCFDREAKIIYYQQQVCKVKKIRVIVEMSDNFQEQFKPKIHYLLVTTNRDRSNNLKAEETWVDEATLNV